MRKCPYCKSDIEETARYCYFCMNDLESKNIIQSKPSFNKKTVILLFSLLSVMLALLVFIGIKFLFTEPDPKQKAVNSSNDSSLQTDAANSDDTQTESYNELENIAPNDDAVLNKPNTNLNSDESNVHTPQQPQLPNAPIDEKPDDVNVNDTTVDVTETPDTPDSHICSHSWQEISETIPSEKKVKYYKCEICYNKFQTLDLYYTHFDSSCGLSPLASIFRERYKELEEWEEYEKKLSQAISVPLAVKQSQLTIRGIYELSRKT